MECIITYQKSNGEIFIRPYNHSFITLRHKKGEETSMGWKIINIHYRHNDNYYCYDDFMRIFRNGVERELKEKRRKRLVKYAIKQLNKLA